MTAILRQLRGIAVFSLFTVNTIVWFVPIFFLAIVKLAVPLPSLRRGITRVLMAIGENWVSVNSAILVFTGSIDWQARGVERLRRDNWLLVMS